MKNKDIFIGTIKKCNNLYCYNEYGEERYVGDFRTRCVESGFIHRYVDIIDEEAMLIKVNDEEYIWVNSTLNFMNELFVNVGIPVKTIGICPTYDNDYFIDKETVVPYFKEDENKRVSVKSLKKLR